MGIFDEKELSIMFDIEVPSPTMELLYGKAVHPLTFLHILNGGEKIEMLTPITRKYVVIKYESEDGPRFSLAYRMSNEHFDDPHTVDHDYPEYDRLKVALAVCDALNETAL